jgi:hypothetical protein
MEGTLQRIEHRLFVDNGSPSFQTRLDRNERIIAVLCWAVTVAGGAAITAIVMRVFA